MPLCGPEIRGAEMSAGEKECGRAAPGVIATYWLAETSSSVEVSVDANRSFLVGDGANRNKGRTLTVQSSYSSQGSAGLVSKVVLRSYLAPFRFVKNKSAVHRFTPWRSAPASCAWAKHV